MKSLVRISVWLPGDIADAYHHRSVSQGISTSACIRETLALDVRSKGEIPAPRKMSIKASKPIPEQEACDSPYNLFARGYSANQIAAVLHMPYREVLAQVGSRVDAMKVGH